LNHQHETEEQPMMKHLLRSRDERGATAVEYGLMVACIAIAIIAGVTVFGLGVNGLFASIPPNL
jgi:pilus assembly protein Flp/PilA